MPKKDTNLFDAFFGMNPISEVDNLVKQFQQIKKKGEGK